MGECELFGVAGYSPNDFGRLILRGDTGHSEKDQAQPVMFAANLIHCHATLASKSSPVIVLFAAFRCRGCVIIISLIGLVLGRVRQAKCQKTFVGCAWLRRLHAWLSDELPWMHRWQCWSMRNRSHLCRHFCLLPGGLLA